MPRFVALLLLVGCSFDGDYTGGTYLCSDGVCPSGYTCSAGVCRLPDARTLDALGDSHVAALTCADPGILSPSGGTVNDTTVGRANMVTASCGGFVTNGPDAVYQIETVGSAMLTVSIAGSYPVNAYVIAPCTVAPATPACRGNALASAGAPITVSAPAGDWFVVVDGVNAALSGSYTLTVSVP